jgi:hypothetical protein
MIVTKVGARFASYLFQVGLFSLAITLYYSQYPSREQAIAGRALLAYNGKIDDYSQ